MRNMDREDFFVYGLGITATIAALLPGISVILAVNSVVSGGSIPKLSTGLLVLAFGLMFTCLGVMTIHKALYPKKEVLQ